MSLTNGQRFLFGALGVSLVAHLVVLLVIRPHFMTKTVDVWHRQARRRAMEMREPKAAPETVRLEVVADLKPLRDSPEAQSEALQHVSSTLASSADETPNPPLPPEVDLPAVAMRPIPEAAPTFSEKVRVEDVPSFVTPLAVESAVGLTPPSAQAKPEVAPSEIAVRPETVEVPHFAAPDLRLPPETLGTTAMRDLRPSDTGAGASAFVPPQQVMADVDKTVVEAEKAAVRELLDVPEARELVKFVDVGAASASQGDWTYFRVRIKPLPDLKPVQKDVVVLMDVSGSIANDRLADCRTRVREILRTCMNTGDRFNLVAFRDSFEYAFRTWRPCDRVSYEKADRWLNNLAAHGRTDVFDTITSVLKLPRDPRRPLIALVVTDGVANTGVAATEEILSRFSKLNDGLISVYMYGVKDEANRELIDVLTHGNRGESLIYDGEERKAAGSRIGALSARFCNPVLTDLRVVFSSSSVAAQAEIYPRMLRNLYADGSVDLVGRVRKGTPSVSFSLKGLNGALAYEGFFRVKLAEAAFDGNLPATWRKEQVIDAKLR